MYRVTFQWTLLALCLMLFRIPMLALIEARQRILFRSVEHSSLRSQWQRHQRVRRHSGVRESNRQQESESVSLGNRARQFDTSDHRRAVDHRDIETDSESRSRNVPRPFVAEKRTAEHPARDAESRDDTQWHREALAR